MVWIAKGPGGSDGLVCNLQDSNLQDTSLQHSNRSRPPTRQMKSSQHFLLLLTALAMPLSTTFASTSTHNIGEPNKPLVQIFTAAYFTPMPQILLYISSIPIIYKIPFNTQQSLPKNEPSLNFCPKHLNNSQTYCTIYNNLSTLQTLIHQQMVAEHLPFIQRQQPDRNRRSLSFVGDFFEWCCDIATEHQIRDLVDNEKEITQHTNALIDKVDTYHQDLLLTTNIMKNFSDGVSINGPYRHPPTSFTIYKDDTTSS
ncbi:hypothetical protein J6590_103441 [Homalodisca vitripennis]|nr:hypothetical protein J6590_103441 [Homalodisca vitripennis]